MIKMQTQNFLLRHSKELSKKYSGKYIAIVVNKVVGVSKSRVDVYKEAKKAFPHKKITLIYMPTQEETVTLL